MFLWEGRRACERRTRAENDFLSVHPFFFGPSDHTFRAPLHTMRARQHKQIILLID